MLAALVNPAAPMPAARRALLFLGPVLWLASLAAYLAAEPHGDVAWYLVAADKWLSGARLYRDVIEINPPLIVYLNAPAVLVSRMTGLPSVAVFVVYVHLLIALSVLLVRAAVRRPAAGAEVFDRLIPFAALFVLTALPVTVFGEREHFLLIFTLPFIALTVRRALGARPALGLAGAVGVFAALGFCLKPQFLAVPLLFEIYLIARLRPRRIVPRAEAVFLGAAAAAYGLSIPLLTPDYLDRVVPFALLAYGAYRQSIVVVLFSWQTLAFLVFALLYPRTRRRLDRPEICDIFLIAFAAFYGIYLTQMKGWSYQLLPAETMTFLFVLALLVVDPLARGVRGFRLWPGAALLGALLLIPAGRGWVHVSTTGGLLPAVRNLPAGSPVFVFSSYVWVGFPLANRAGLRWPSRFPCLWLLPAAEQGLRAAADAADPHRLAALRGLQLYTLKAVVDDFVRDPPAAVIVDRRPDPRFPDGTFDYPAFFGRDARFARLWRDYRVSASVTTEGLGPYVVYRRAPADRP